MNGIEISKLLLSFVVSTSVGAVVKNVVKHSMPLTAPIAERILTGIGTLVISTVVGEKCADYIEEQIFKEGEKK